MKQELDLNKCVQELTALTAPYTQAEIEEAIAATRKQLIKQKPHLVHLLDAVLAKIRANS